MLESLFDKVVDLRPATSLKRHSGTGAFLCILQHLFYRLFSDKVVGLTEHFRVTASDHCNIDLQFWELLSKNIFKMVKAFQILTLEGVLILRKLSNNLQF